MLNLGRRGAIDNAMMDGKIHKYVVSRPFDKALKLIRQTLKAHGLSIVTEMDLSERISRELGVKLAAYRILFVDTPINLLKFTMLDGAAAAYLPLHVVVVAKGELTDIYILNRETLAAIGSPFGAYSILNRFHAQLSEALDLLDSTRMEKGQPKTA